MYTILLDNKLHLAPLDKNIHRVLDIGTGTGKGTAFHADESLVWV